jgi:integrase/recombinase XerD
MVEQFFRHPHVITRFRSTSLSGTLDDLAAYLYERGYARATAQSYLRGAAHLGYWTDAEGIAPERLTEESITCFLEQHLPRCRCPVPRGLPLRDLHAAVAHLRTVLRKTGRIPPRASPQAPAEILVDEFRRHLEQVQGARERTCSHYTYYAREFLAAKFASAPIELAHLASSELINFVEEHAMRWRPKTTKLLATSLRSFLRFMQVTGRCDGRLVSAIPTIPEWKLSRLPKLITDSQLHALLASFDRRSTVGQRDLAIALCLCRMALRANEVAQLRIDDIDWRSATVEIRGKSRRASQLPLPSDVGDAIVNYLRHGRPRTTERHVFVRHIIPLGGPIDADAVRALIRRAFERTGLQVPSKGTHVLRHTAATRMVRAGATLKEVADVLRHRSLDTTAVYAKVDLPRLVEVALPWPEVQS